MHVSDFTKDPKQVVLDLVNSNLVPGIPALTLGQVEIVLDTEDGSKLTTAHLVSKTGSGYRGDADFTYSRVGLNEIPGFEANVVETEQETLSGILQEINIRYGLNILPEDITVDGVPLTQIASDNIGFSSLEPVAFQLAAVPSSFVWTGIADIQVRPLVVELSRAIPITALDGLYPPTGNTAGVPEEELFGKQFTLAPSGDALNNFGELSLINSANTKAITSTRVDGLGQSIPLHFNIFDIDEEGEWSSNSSFSSTLITGVVGNEAADIWISHTAANEDMSRIVLFGKNGTANCVWFIGTDQGGQYALISTYVTTIAAWNKFNAINVLFTAGKGHVFVSYQGHMLDFTPDGQFVAERYGPGIPGNLSRAAYFTIDGEIHVSNMMGMDYCVFKYNEVDGEYIYQLKRPDGSWTSEFDEQYPEITYTTTDDNGEAVSSLTIRSISVAGNNSAYLLGNNAGYLVYRHRVFVDGQLKLITAIDDLSMSVLRTVPSFARVVINASGSFAAYRADGSDGKHAKVQIVKNNPVPGSDKYVEGQSLAGAIYPDSVSALRPAGTDLNSSLDNPNPRALRYGESMGITEGGIFVGDAGSNITENRTDYPSIVDADLSKFGRGAVEFVPMNSSLFRVILA